MLDPDCEPVQATVLTMRRTILLLLGASLLALLSLPSSRAQELQPSPSLDARLTLRACESLTDQHLEDVLTALKALAATQEAVAGDWQRLRPPLSQLARGLSTSAAVWFARPDGSYYTVASGLTGQSLSGRHYFPGLIRGKDVIGSLVISKSTGERSVIVATPIVSEGRITGALGVSLSATKLSARVRDGIKPPANFVFYALDSQGRTAVHEQSDLIFQFPSDLGDQSLKSAVKRMLSAPEGVVHYTFRNTRRTAVFRRSARTGWVFALGIVEPASAAAAAR